MSTEIKLIKYQNIEQCQHNEYDDQAIQKISPATSDPRSVEILLIDVDVAGIEVGVVLSVYSSFHHVSPTSWPSMMIGALETIKKYETTNAHLVNDKYAKRI